ncbi:MAG TPA: helix-turn-helix domain-containing protein [Candidatus Limnocylindrales bacterium]|nr:helix-turn-helix domain-containing protein [Candidatus Limnocylindrales bacterium]
MTTLADLRADLFPAARPVGDLDATPRPIAWVRVMKARVPAFDALEADDLAVVPASALAVVAPTRGDLEPLVAAFVATPVAGVLLLEGESLAPDAGSRLDELAGALAAVPIGGLRLPPADPSAVERSVIGVIVGRAAELERQAGLLESELERRALVGEGAAGLVAAAATFLARALALEGPRGEAMTVHAPVEAPDAAPAVAAYAAGRRDAVALRVALPSGGAIVLLGPRPPTDLEQAAVARVAGLLALELARDEAIRLAADRGGRREALPSGGPPWVVALARQRDPGSDAGDAAGRERREQLRREIRLLAPARRLALRGDADSLEIRLVCGDGAGTDELVMRAAALLGRTVAVSRPFATPADRPAAEAEARATLEAATALPNPPGVAHAERLAAYRLLGALRNLPDGQRLARAILEPLQAGRPDVRRERLETLRAILDHGGVNEAAAALGVHRNTVAYRLRRIEDLTGWQLADPELRVPLALALRIVQDA